MCSTYRYTERLMSKTEFVKKQPAIRQQQDVSLVCQRCAHSWRYRGYNPYFAICSFCKTTVQVRRSKDDMTANAVIQTVSTCLTSDHNECSGLYSDQTGNVLVRCACKCHELGGQQT